MYLAAVLPDRRLYLYVGNGPGKIALQMGLNIRERKLERSQRIAFRFNVVLDQIIKPYVLPTGLDIACAIEVQEMGTKRATISLLPALLDGLDDIHQRCCFIIRKGEAGCPRKNHADGDSNCTTPGLSLYLSHTYSILLVVSGLPASGWFRLPRPTNPAVAIAGRLRLPTPS